MFAQINLLIVGYIIMLLVMSPLLVVNPNRNSDIVLKLV